MYAFVCVVVCMQSLRFSVLCTLSVPSSFDVCTRCDFMGIFVLKKKQLLLFFRLLLSENELTYSASQTNNSTV